MFRILTHPEIKKNLKTHVGVVPLYLILKALHTILKVLGHRKYPSLIKAILLAHHSLYNVFVVTVWS